MRAAGAGVARERVVPALTREDLEDRYLATATPIAFAAALPHCGPGALEAFTREYVARECLKTQTLERSDGARDDDGGITSGLFLESSSLAERAIRRAVSLCDDGDDAAGTVRDAITRVLAAVASFRGASAEEDEKPRTRTLGSRRNRARLAGDDAAWRGGGGVPRGVGEAHACL